MTVPAPGCRTEIRPVCSSTNKRPEVSGGATRPTGATRPSTTVSMAASAAMLGSALAVGAPDGAALAVAVDVAATPADEAGGTTLGDAGPHAAAQVRTRTDKAIAGAARVGAGRSIVTAALGMGSR